MPAKQISRVPAGAPFALIAIAAPALVSTNRPLLDHRARAFGGLSNGHVDDGSFDIGLPRTVCVFEQEHRASGELPPLTRDPTKDTPRKVLWASFDIR